MLYLDRLPGPVLVTDCNGRVKHCNCDFKRLAGAGAAEGATDAANLLKPALARGELRCIGATTPASGAFTTLYASGKSAFGDVNVKYNAITINGGHVGDGDTDYGLTINAFEPGLARYLLNGAIDSTGLLNALRFNPQLRLQTASEQLQVDMSAQPVLATLEFIKP